MTLQYNKLMNAALYQAIWLTAVFGTHQYEWLLVGLIGLHLWFTRDTKREAALMGLCALIGCSVDAMFTHLGVFVFEYPTGLLPIPLWLAAIWLGFIGTLRNSMSFMVKRPLIMTLAAGVFAPLSYASAMRFGAVSFPYGLWHTSIAVGLSWMVMMPLFIRLTDYFSRASGDCTNKPAAQSTTRNTQA